MSLADRRAQPGLDRAVRPLLIVWTGCVALLAAVRLQGAASPEQLFLDPAYYTGTGWYTGLVSSLGILAWTVAVAGCVATWFVTSLAGRPAAAAAFRAGALVVALQLFDDLFLFHAALLPSITGLPKQVWLLALLGVTVRWLVRSASELARTRWGLLVAAGAALGLSLVIDTIVAVELADGPWVLLAEDGPKLLGIVALATWSTMTAADVIRSVVSTRGRDARLPIEVNGDDTEPAIATR